MTTYRCSTLAIFCQQKLFSSYSSRSNYIEKWHEATVKPSSFYTDQAAGRNRKCYFYSIDLQGRVFLEEVLPKNLATSLKNIQLLDTFFRNIRRVSAKEYQYLSTYGAQNDYPYVSPCGIEMNYVRPADLAICFHSLRETSRDNSGCVSKELCFGGTLTQPFSPGMLAISKRTGRIYHSLSCNNEFPTQLHKGEQEYGLLKSSLAVEISDNLVDGAGLADGQTEDTNAGMDYICTVTGARFPIVWLPDSAEPGSWSLSFEQDKHVLSSKKQPEMPDGYL